MMRALVAWLRSDATAPVAVPSLYASPRMAWARVWRAAW